MTSFEGGWRNGNAWLRISENSSISSKSTQFEQARGKGTWEKTRDALALVLEVSVVVTRVKRGPQIMVNVEQGRLTSARQGLKSGPSLGG